VSGPVIRVEKLSKSYLVGHRSAQRERYTALRDVIGREAKNFARKAIDFAQGRQIIQGDEVEEFWALKDVTFAVHEGEVLGVIGRNGAGKSTLLKILSRITEPTLGRVRIRGRVASLLEVGTGFHPELTGRENIYLNGAILGMTQREIKRKFDEIVAFADVERFLDTPIKRFSSGMYVRLAFAVAAHLEPEILVVDEVLAVGDAEFQQRCLGKMKGVANSGRTILFVSHNMAAVQSLCQRVIYLDRGCLKSEGEPQAQIQSYLASASDQNQNHQLMAGNAITISQVSLAPNPVHSGSDLHFQFNLQPNYPSRLSAAVFAVYTLDGHRVGLIDLRPAGFPFTLKADDCLRIKGTLRSIPLVEREYRVSLWIDSTTFVGEIPNVADLIISPSPAKTICPPFAAQYRGWIEFETKCSGQVSSILTQQ
jgi:ABC-type polysaccharide/polyol phosphate transport system ATPase subunit